MLSTITALREVVSGYKAYILGLTLLLTALLQFAGVDVPVSEGKSWFDTAKEGAALIVGRSAIKKIEA